MSFALHNDHHNDHHSDGLKDNSHHSVFKSALVKVKAIGRLGKRAWLRVNNDDPELAKVGLVSAVLIAILCGISLYVSCLDGFFKEFWLTLANGVF